MGKASLNFKSYTRLIQKYVSFGYVSLGRVSASRPA